MNLRLKRMIEDSVETGNKYKKIYFGEYNADYENIKYSHHSHVFLYCEHHDKLIIRDQHRWCKKIKVRLFDDEVEIIKNNDYKIADDIWYKITTREV